MAGFLWRAFVVWGSFMFVCFALIGTLVVLDSVWSAINGVLQ